MKKIILIIAILLFSLVQTDAQEVIYLDIQEEKNFFENILATNTEKLELNLIETEETEVTKINIEKNISQPTDIQQSNKSKIFLNNALAQTIKDIYELEIEKTDTVRPLLKDKLFFETKKGPLESIQLWSAYQMNFSTTIPEQGDTDSKFNFGVVNILVDGKFKGGKEGFRILLDPSHRSTHPNFMQTFFQDFYVESNRIAHTNILIGNSRPGVGIEGAQSPYTLPFINRAQISRNFSNARKMGVRVRGDYSLIDYDTGIYSSCTNFTDFFPGQEYNGWVNLKPLGKTKGKYGKIITGGGIQSGEKHGMSYFTSGVNAGYEYKKFWTKVEYAKANGSNGSTGLTNKRAQGMFVTAGYKLTPKLEILARIDQFDPDRTVKNNNQKEYTLGTNYYLKGQSLKLIFNYIYAQNDNKKDSHRLMIGTQIIL